MGSVYCSKHAQLCAGHSRKGEGQGEPAGQPHVTGGRLALQALTHLTWGRLPSSACASRGERLPQVTVQSHTLGWAGATC